MKRNWILGFASLFLVVALAAGIHAVLTSNAYNLAPWNYRYILTFRGRQYHVSPSHETQLGRYLATVSYHGASSGTYRIYAIPGFPKYSSIAVQTNAGYLVATEER